MAETLKKSKATKLLSPSLNSGTFEVNLINITIKESVHIAPPPHLLKNKLVKSEICTKFKVRCFILKHLVMEDLTITRRD